MTKRLGMLAGALLVGGASAVGMGFATQVDAPGLASPDAASDATGLDFTRQKHTSCGVHGA